MLDPLNDELCDALTAHDAKGVLGIGVDEQHLELAAIAGVDETRRVEARDPVLQGEPAAWLHEAGIPDGYCNGGAGGHERSSATRRELDVVARDEVGTRITVGGVGRHREVGVEADDRNLEHGGTIDRPPVTATARAVSRYHRRMLAWMDLEMTGLDPDRHVIVEIATLITDDNLELVAEGPDLVIFQPPEALAHMDDFVRDMHTRSGLLAQIEASTISAADAAAETLAFLRTHIPEARSVPLCGNSIGTDRRFLARWFPDIEDYLHYRSVDVSTLKELTKRWYPAALAAAPKKARGHRALDDIRESLTELRFYRDNVFRNGTDHVVPVDKGGASTPTA